MAQDWIGKFFENRGWLGITQYDSTNGLNVSGTRIDYETVTLAQFQHANFDLTNERVVFVSDVPADRSLQGGSFWRIVPDATVKRKLISEAVCYSTFAAAIAAFPIASYTGLAYRCGDVGDYNVRLLSNGTRVKPESGVALLYQNVYGNVASPSKSTGTGAASFVFDIGTRLIPAGLFASGDHLEVVAVVRKNNANGAATPVTFLGTAGDATDSQGYGTAVGNVDDIDVEMNSRFWFNSSTAAVAIQSNDIAVAAGSTNVLRDRSTKLNTASNMYITIGIGSKHISDDLNLLYWRAVWRSV